MMIPTIRRFRSVTLAVVLATTLTATGCHMPDPYTPTPPDVAAKALDALKALPSFEETQTQVQTVMDEITSATSRLIPGTAWESFDEGSGLGCQQPYEQTGGRGYLLPDRVAVRVSVSEQQWAQIQETARTAAAKLEATEIQVMQDNPGHHDVGFYGPTGLFIKVGYGGNLVVSGYTGCRLPREGK